MLGQIVCFMAALGWLYEAGRWPRFFEAFRLVGRMTLTNYLVQNLIGMLLFSGVGSGLLQRTPYWEHTVLALAVFAAQIVFSRFWLARGMPAKVYELGLQQRVVVFEFDSAEQAVAARDSLAYQEALRALGDGAERDLRIVPGVE